MVPKTYVANWFWAGRKSAEREPIGGRIIDVPEHLEHFESRDSHATFIAYVPPGSLKRGDILVRGKPPVVYRLAPRAMVPTRVDWAQSHPLSAARQATCYVSCMNYDREYAAVPPHRR